MHPQQRMVWLDCLRLMAGLSMLALHCTADPNGLPWVQYTFGERLPPLILRSVFYLARTELFVLISCFLLVLSLDRQGADYTQTIRDYARKLLVPFAFWVVFFAFFNLLKAQHFGYFESNVNALLSPSVWVRYFVLGDVKYHMHFLPTLFAILLFFPVFMVAKDKPAVAFLVLPLLYLKTLVESYLYSTFWGTPELAYFLRALKIVTYLGYGLVAAALAGVWKRGGLRSSRPVLLACLACGVVIVGIKARILIQIAREEAWVYDSKLGYWADFSAPIILFVLFMAAAHIRLPALASKVAPYSFGMYLCHPIFLDVFEVFAQAATEVSPILQVTLKIAFAGFSTAVFSFCLSKSPMLAWTIGLGRFPIAKRRLWGRRFAK